MVAGAGILAKRGETVLMVGRRVGGERSILNARTGFGSRSACKISILNARTAAPCTDSTEKEASSPGATNGWTRQGLVQVSMQVVSCAHLVQVLTLQEHLKLKIQSFISDLL